MDIGSVMGKIYFLWYILNPCKRFWFKMWCINSWYGDLFWTEYKERKLRLNCSWKNNLMCICAYSLDFIHSLPKLQNRSLSAFSLYNDRFSVVNQRETISLVLQLGYSRFKKTNQKGYAKGSWAQMSSKSLGCSFLFSVVTCCFFNRQVEDDETDLMWEIN